MGARRVAAVTTGAVVVAAALALASCATMRQVIALRQVRFEIDRVTAVRLAGVNLDGKRSPRDVSPLEATRITAAALRGQLPLAFEVHLIGMNPAENRTTARLVRFAWTLYLDDQEAIAGTLDTAYTFAPGVTTDVRLPVSLDVLRVFRRSGPELLDLALGLAGLGTRQTKVEITAVPTIDTPLGGIRYPEPITIVRRTVGGPASGATARR